jgi:aspartokinase/homoserine dehydrogenase 1
VHVITPNKKLNSGPLARYAALKEHQRTSYIHYFYEATVGAGLPVVATLQHLLASGDRIERIEGIFSGTLSYIFNSYAPAAGGAPFSAVVLGAKAEGYTEPDPRDDLSGADVARKVTILARECGLELELADVPVRSLVPGALSEVSVEEYLARLPEFDAEMAALAAEAEAAGEVLRYVGVVDVAGGGGAVELRRYPKVHAFASLTGSDNIIAFSTARYAAQPLVIRGPGAGAEVTAGGVFSDLLRLAAYLGAAS